MARICTIGYTQKTLERFIHLLQEAGVDAVIDIRLRNTSQLAGYTKRDDFSFLLRTCFNIAYEHRTELAPTPEIIAAYRATDDWTAYERAFLPVLDQEDAEAIGRQLLSRYLTPCLLCAEPEPDRCHRRLVAEWWAERLPDVEVLHLV
jgi:uncharacterized protein (DUF488 family)